jgi:hypothetical protein
MRKIFMTGLILSICTAIKIDIGEGLFLMIPTMILVIAVFIFRLFETVASSIEIEEGLEAKAKHDQLKRELEWYEVAECNRAANYLLN